MKIATTRCSLVRILSDGDVPDCLHKCTIAVKLADAKYAPRLDAKALTNSKNFADAMRRLRSRNAAAVLGKDKHGRFGLLVPDNRTAN